MDPWIAFITDVGFPIAVTFYLLHRIEGKLNVLIDSIHALPERLNYK
ncbi:MAG: YvrJ family protein [Bacillota bacterium]|uniref:YvrJ family protein n=1 Tax=Virgibacillus salarius TaxID=447199 RepID=A0A941IAW3_9BACI|nr:MULTISPECIES: YvrJ family protein [Bacillaceae]NAZ08494.1 YvrJ family protein [Agaribacter marinus]MBR7795781.1 YvrJ family protein [Virgibacillus salarius]MCC2248667.1 YvrJ family protein [Virgibacillus sp. AGTR]MDY7044958.1 YvrJ family protein [Virgibacillus sp. M23]QRZ18423.1 YvrJ family protein [Virgibacillus sp. AGTR]